MPERDTPEWRAANVLRRMGSFGPYSTEAFLGQCTDEEISVLGGCETGNDFKRIREAVEYRLHSPAWTREQYANEIERLEKDLAASVITREVCDLVVDHLHVAQLEMAPEPEPVPEPEPE